jgi:uncharacterized coiled-coil protein SlyX
MMYPGTYESFLWSQNNKAPVATIDKKSDVKKPVVKVEQSYEERKRDTGEQRKREKAFKALKARISELEMRIADREKAIKDVEQAMSAADFYNDHEQSKPVLAKHQALMWEVGELLGQWEMLQSEADQYADIRNS